MSVVYESTDAVVTLGETISSAVVSLGTSSEGVVITVKGQDFLLLFKSADGDTFEFSSGGKLWVRG